MLTIASPSADLPAPFDHRQCFDPWQDNSAAPSGLRDFASPEPLAISARTFRRSVRSRAA